MHTAVLMASMPSAVQVGAMWIAVHVSMMMKMTSRTMHLTVLVISISLAIEVAAMGIAMHVPVMVMVPVIPVDVNTLRLLHNPIWRWDGRPDRRRLDRCCRKRQDEPCAQ
jgi:hypothetical protein